MLKIQRTMILLISIAISGCQGGESPSAADKAPGHPGKNELETSISGHWATSCISESSTGSSPYLVQELTFREGSVKAIYSRYSDEKCNQPLDSTGYVGRYQVGTLTPAIADGSIHFDISSVIVTLFTQQGVESANQSRDCETTGSWGLNQPMDVTGTPCAKGWITAADQSFDLKGGQLALPAWNPSLFTKTP